MHIHSCPSSHSPLVTTPHLEQVKECMLTDQTNLIHELRSRLHHEEKQTLDLTAAVAEWEARGEGYRVEVEGLRGRLVEGRAGEGRLREEVEELRERNARLGRRVRRLEEGSDSEDEEESEAGEDEGEGEAEVEGEDGEERERGRGGLRRGRYDDAEDDDEEEEEGEEGGEGEPAVRGIAIVPFPSSHTHRSQSQTKPHATHATHPHPRPRRPTRKSLQHLVTSLEQQLTASALAAAALHQREEEGARRVEGLVAEVAGCGQEVALVREQKEALQQVRSAVMWECVWLYLVCM